MIFSTDETNEIIESIYLFGSFIKSDNAIDIDILIIYHYFGDFKTVQALLKLKKNIGNSVYHTFKLPIHFMTLSTEEFDCAFFPQQDLIKLY